MARGKKYYFRRNIVYTTGIYIIIIIQYKLVKAQYLTQLN